MKALIVILAYISLAACSKTEHEPEQNLYFPPNGNAAWETVSPETLGWDTDKIPDLLDLLESNGTRAFIVLKDGRIVLEAYFGKTIIGNNDFNSSSYWYWASAGKTLTAMVTGIAQQEGLLSIQDKTSKYLGENWTSLNADKENLITIRHQLTMTTGLDDGVADNHDFSAENLLYKADAGTRWAYHNAPYTLLDQVIENAVGQNFDAYFNEKIVNKIGMDGFWQWINNDHVYFSNARSMARFGLLVLNKGTWNDVAVISDKTFFNDMINTSQNLNKSYGYLWWLNGKESYRAPMSQLVFPWTISPNAPSDLITGLGKNGQFVSVVPSKNLVMVRMGESPDDVPVPFFFHDEIWKKLTLIVK